MRCIKRLGVVRIAILQPPFVTVMSFRQARAGGIRLDALQIPTVVSRTAFALPDDAAP